MFALIRTVLRFNCSVHSKIENFGPSKKIAIGPSHASADSEISRCIGALELGCKISAGFGTQSNASEKRITRAVCGVGRKTDVGRLKNVQSIEVSVGLLNLARSVEISFGEVRCFDRNPLANPGFFVFVSVEESVAVKSAGILIRFVAAGEVVFVVELDLPDSVGSKGLSKGRILVLKRLIFDQHVQAYIGSRLQSVRDKANRVFRKSKVSLFAKSVRNSASLRFEQSRSISLADFQFAALHDV